MVTSRNLWSKLTDNLCFAVVKFENSIRLLVLIVSTYFRLPCVVSVGFSKDSKFTVFVSDRNKALELSEELDNPNINLVEARNSHLI